MISRLYGVAYRIFVFWCVMANPDIVPSWPGCLRALRQGRPGFLASRLLQPCYKQAKKPERMIMALKVASRELDGVTILDLSGRITLGEGCVQMRDAILGSVGNGNKNIVLNMGDVSYIDSSGVGELVGVFSAAKRLGAKLRLLKLTKKVRDVLEMTKLYPLFDVYDDETLAFESFK